MNTSIEIYFRESKTKQAKTDFHSFIVCVPEIVTKKCLQKPKRSSLSAGKAASTSVQSVHPYQMRSIDRKVESTAACLLKLITGAFMTGVHRKQASSTTFYRKSQLCHANDINRAPHATTAAGALNQFKSCNWIALNYSRRRRESERVCAITDRASLQSEICSVASILS